MARGSSEVTVEMIAWLTWRNAGIIARLIVVRKGSREGCRNVERHHEDRSSDVREVGDTRQSVFEEKKKAMGASCALINSAEQQAWLLTARHRVAPHRVFSVKNLRT